MDKNVQLLFWGAGLSLSSVGLVWMITTLVSVDKRTEVMDVKIDHLSSVSRKHYQKGSLVLISRGQISFQVSKVTSEAN